jgi:hypothetical protein
MTRQTRIGEPKGWDFPADMCEHKIDVPRCYEKGDDSEGLLTRGGGQERRDGGRHVAGMSMCIVWESQSQGRKGCDSLILNR